MKKFLLLTIIFTTFCFTTTATKAYEIKQYYKCPSKQLYSPSETLESFCKETDKMYSAFGVDASCQDLYKDEFKTAEKEFYTGQCKPTDFTVMEDEYNGVKCGITYTTSPTPKIIATSTFTNSRITINSEENRDANSLQCVENLHKQLKNIYPNIK